MFYRFGHFIFLVITRLLFRLEVFGLNNLPEQGPCILCANHISWYDPLALAIAVPARLPVHFMAKEELFRNRLAAFILRQVHAFPVNRQIADYSAIKRAFLLLKENKVLGLFPEGTRSKNKELQRAHNGAALIASRSKVPVIPVYITGSYRFRKPLRIYFGEPFVLQEPVFKDRKERKVKIGQLSSEIMDKIRALKP